MPPRFLRPVRNSAESELLTALVWVPAAAARSSLHSAFAQAGVSVVEAEHADDFARQAPHGFDLLVLAHEQPGFFSGLEVATRLAERHDPGTIGLLGTLSEDAAQEARRLGIGCLIPGDRAAPAVRDWILRRFGGRGQPCSSPGGPLPPRVDVERERLFERIGRLLGMLQLGVVDFDDLLAELEWHPAAATTLSRLARDSVPATAPVATLRDAVTILGPRRALRTTVDMCLAPALFRWAQTVLPQDLQAWFQRRCMAIRAAALLVARQIPSVASDDAEVAATVQELGLLLLAEPDACRYAALIRRVRSSPHERIAVRELAELGHCHAAAGAERLRHWNWPEAVVKGVAEHHHFETCGSNRSDDPSPLARVLTLSEATADLFDLACPEREHFWIGLHRKFGIQHAELFRENLAAALTASHGASEEPPCGPSEDAARPPHPHHRTQARIVQPPEPTS